VSKKFKEISVLYRIFASGWTGLDFSDESLIEMYNSESYGTPVDQKKNGFYVGKQWLGVTVSMWKEDRKSGHLVLSELYEDERFPHWWLDKVLR
jgi:hypothetical protein